VAGGISFLVANVFVARHFFKRVAKLAVRHAREAIGAPAPPPGLVDGPDVT
jgi:hypothetical protein